MRQQVNILKQIDWMTFGLFYILVFMGWLNIYASVYDEEIQQNIFDLSLNSGRQLVFIGSTLIVIILIMAVDFRFYDTQPFFSCLR